MHRRAVALLSLVLALTAWTAVDGAKRALSASESYVRHIRFLASDELKGRGNGSKELAKAGDYIASEFKAAGLKPGGPNNSWFQPFDIVTGLTIGGGNKLTMHATGQSTAFDLASSYYPMSALAGDDGQSGRDLRQVPIVFAGYGISARQLKYDDYAGIDAHGKAVLVFSHEPQELDAASKFNGKQPSSFSTLIDKTMAAKNHGAVALLIVGDPSHEKDPATFAGFGRDPQAENFGIPVLRVDRSRAQALLTAWGVDALAREIDRDLQPRSRVLPGAMLDYSERLTRTRRTVRNVIGVLPGSDQARASEAVVIGAHYDHLGLGGAHSLSPEMAGQIHNGADDNASGTAAVIEMARNAAADRKRFPRTTVFTAFAGEELGLLGSTYYVNHPSVPLDRTVAMVNLDMVGRAKENVMVSGLDASPSVGTDMDAAAEAGHPIEVKRFQNGAGVGASDDTSFILKKVPAFGFFSGFHSDYHRPTDDWDRIDAEGGVKVMRMAYELASRLSSRMTRPEFIPQEAPQHGGTSSGETSQAGGYGAYFGSVPDFSQSEKGVKFAEVRHNSPAGKAGLKGGDVLVEFAGKAVTSLADFTFALREHSPGEAVQVTVIRSGQPLTVSVLLTARP
ncbi:MAG: M28 family peptidase [Vicinamibacterales bacterium]